MFGHNFRQLEINLETGDPSLGRYLPNAHYRMIPAIVVWKKKQHRKKFINYYDFFASEMLLSPYRNQILKVKPYSSISVKTMDMIWVCNGLK